MPPIPGAISTRGVKIAAVVPTTLIDYPDRVAALVYTAGCNLRCPFCHNSELVLPEAVNGLSLIQENALVAMLTDRQTFLDGVVITGGEPTIQSDLRQFIEWIKGLDLLVKLDTNGTRPEVLEALLEAHLLDYVAMDLKAPTARYDELTGVRVDPDAIERSIHLILERAPDYEFRTTAAPTLTAEDLEQAAAWIAGAKRYILQPFVLPEGKRLVEPSWETKAALSEGELHAVWDRIEPRFGDGGVR